MKMLLINLIFLMCTHLPSPTEKSARQWLVTDKSTLEISGDANVTTFCCETTTYQGTDTLHERWNTGQATWELSGDISMQVSEFDCHHNILNKDFQKTLMAGKFPVIQIRFLSLQKDMSGSKVSQANGMVEINLGNETKKYTLTCDLRSLDDGLLLLEGTQVIRFTDFNLTPPRKMLGLIKVDDEVEVKFSLVLQKLS